LTWYISEYGIDVSLVDPSNPSAPPFRTNYPLKWISQGLGNPYHIVGIVAGRDLDGFLTCIDDWSVQYNIEPQSLVSPSFSDNFNRNTLGSAYEVPFTTPVMSGNEVCGDTQSAIIYNTPVTNPVLVDYFYTATAASDWESYVLASSDLLGTTVGIMGMDSGVTLRIALNMNSLAAVPVSLTDMPKINNTYYHIVAFASGTVLVVDLRTFDDRLIASQYFDIDTLGVTFNYFGLIVGRTQDGDLTCADNFVIQYQPPSPAGSGLNGGAALTISVGTLVLGLLSTWLFY